MTSPLAPDPRGLGKLWALITYTVDHKEVNFINESAWKKTLSRNIACQLSCQLSHVPA